MSVKPIIFGMLRIKNEARWIDEVIQSILPLCEHVFVLDDHSTDGTAELVEWIDPKRVTVFRSTFEGLDESRDKNFLLDKIAEHVPPEHLVGAPDAPYWVLAIDGDEVLAPGAQKIVAEFCETSTAHVAKLPILYLWDRRNQVRVDGVYNNFVRPSLFRLNKKFSFKTTVCGDNSANLHCSSTPQELLEAAVRCEASLLHLGYMDRADRIRKYEWYNKIDPNDEKWEDCYRHIVIGDVFPADSKFRYAGPLQLKRLPTFP